MRRHSNLLLDAPPTPPVEQASTPARPTSYVELYGLSKRPFGDRVEGAAFILFPSHRRAFELLVNHVLNGDGAVLLTGDEGIGKTEMLCAVADMAKGHGLQVIHLVRPPDRPLSHKEFAEALAGRSLRASADLIPTLGDDGRKVVLIDDFDLLPSECVSLLSPTMEPAEAAPTMILAGTSGLRRPEIAPLLGLLRNTVRLIPLSPAECRQFIERSFWIAGGTTRRLMQRDSIRVVIAESGGSPGRIARLMDAALTAGFARADAMITIRTISVAIGPASRHRRWRTLAGDNAVGRAAAIISVVLFLTGAGLFAYRAWRGSTHVGAPRPVMTQPVADTRRSPAPAPASNVSADVLATLLKRGQDSLALGDIAAARLLLQKAAEAGSATAALTVGRTYDPNEPVSQPGTVDTRQAANWYRRAQALGEPTAMAMLHRLGIER